MFFPQGSSVVFDRYTLNRAHLHSNLLNCAFLFFSSKKTEKPNNNLPHQVLINADKCRVLLDGTVASHGCGL